jgi:hypothetical protein
MVNKTKTQVLGPTDAFTVATATVLPTPELRRRLWNAVTLTRGSLSHNAPTLKLLRDQGTPPPAYQDHLVEIQCAFRQLFDSAQRRYHDGKSLEEAVDYFFEGLLQRGVSHDNANTAQVRLQDSLGGMINPVKRRFPTVYEAVFLDFSTGAIARHSAVEARLRREVKAVQAKCPDEITKRDVDTFVNEAVARMARSQAAQAANHPDAKRRQAEAEEKKAHQTARAARREAAARETKAGKAARQAPLVQEDVDGSKPSSLPRLCLHLHTAGLAERARQAPPPGLEGRKLKAYLAARRKDFATTFKRGCPAHSVAGGKAFDKACADCKGVQSTARSYLTNPAKVCLGFFFFTNLRVLCALSPALLSCGLLEWYVFGSCHHRLIVCRLSVSIFLVQRARLSSYLDRTSHLAAVPSAENNDVQGVDAADGANNS